jgi:hypothetical protein
MVGAANIVLDGSLKIHYYGNNSDTLRTLYGVRRLGLHQCLRLWHKDRVTWGSWSLYRFERIIAAFRDK